MLLSSRSIRLSECIAIIFLYSIKWFAFVMEKHCVFSEVATEFLNSIKITHTSLKYFPVTCMKRGLLMYNLFEEVPVCCSSMVRSY
jgi:hypothetical protein